MRTAELQEALAKYGMSVFVAHADIEPGSEWQDQIELALSTCDGMAALMTPEFHASNWTDQEIGFAMGRGLLIVLIRAGQDPYGFIGKFQAVPGEGRIASEMAADLFKVLLKSKQTGERIKEGLVTAFEQQAYFKEAIACSKLLEEVKDFPDPLRRRIRAAIDNSRLLANAYGVPDRIQRVFPASEDRVPETPTPSYEDDVPF